MAGIPKHITVYSVFKATLPTAEQLVISPKDDRRRHLVSLKLWANLATLQKRATLDPENVFVKLTTCNKYQQGNTQATYLKLKHLHFHLFLHEFFRDHSLLMPKKPVTCKSFKIASEKYEEQPCINFGIIRKCCICNENLQGLHLDGEWILAALAAFRLLMVLLALILPMRTSTATRSESRSDVTPRNCALADALHMLGSGAPTDRD